MAISTIRDLSLLVITFLSAALVYRQYAAGNLNADRLMALIAKHETQQPEIAEPEPPPLQRRSQADPPARYPPRPVGPSDRSEPRSKPRIDPAQVGSGRNERRSLAQLLEENPPAPTGIVLAEIPLDISDGRQMSELPSDYDRASIRISAVTGFPQSATILPGEGSLTDGSKVEICPFGDRSVYLIAQIVEPAGESPRLMIEAKTSFDWIGGDRLTDDRLRRKRNALVKQANLAAAARAAAAAEIANLIAYIRSHTVKPLQNVGQAKDRIAALQRISPRLDAQVVTAQQQVVQFDQFCKTVGTAFKEAAIVLEVDPPPVAADAMLQTARFEEL